MQAFYLPSAVLFTLVISFNPNITYERKVIGIPVLHLVLVCRVLTRSLDFSALPGPGGELWALQDLLALHRPAPWASQGGLWA